MSRSELYEALNQIIPSDKIDSWMTTPNPAFDEKTPLQLIEEGKWQMIHQIDGSVPN